MQIVSKKLLKMFDHLDIGTKMGSTTTAGKSPIRLLMHCSSGKSVPTKQIWRRSRSFPVQSAAGTLKKSGKTGPQRHHVEDGQEAKGTNRKSQYDLHGMCRNILEAPG